MGFIFVISTPLGILIGYLIAKMTSVLVIEYLTAACAGTFIYVAIVKHVR